SLLNQGSSIISNPKFDSLLEEFSGELAHIDIIPPGINEVDFDPEEEIRLYERLLYDNLSPRPLEEFYSKNSDVIIKSFSPSPILVEDKTRSDNTTHANYSFPEYDSFCFEIEPDHERLINLVENDVPDNSSNDPLLEEAKLFLSDDSIPPGIENVVNDPEGDVRFLEELLIDDSILSHELSDDNFDLEPEVISAAMEDIDEPDEHFNPRREINFSTNNEDVNYFPFMFVIRIFLPYLIIPEISSLLLSAESEDTIFDPAQSRFSFPIALPKDELIRGSSQAQDSDAATWRRLAANDLCTRYCAGGGWTNGRMTRHRRHCVFGPETQTILGQCHYGPTGGYYGPNITAKKVLDTGFYWPTIIKESRTLVRLYEACQKTDKGDTRIDVIVNNNEVSRKRELTVRFKGLYGVTTAQISTTMTAKLPILNLREYDLWLMRIEEYFLMTDYSFWEVIKNGNKVQKRTVRAVEQIYESTSAEEKLDMKNEMKARGTLLMALPNKDQLKFHSYKYAKFLMEAIGKREDLDQIDPDDLEEMDLHWEMAMLIIRAKRFIKRTGRNFDINGQKISFDRSKVECFNCHKNRHFTRECRTPKNQENKGREYSRKTMRVENPTENALIAQDGIRGYDWSYQAKEEHPTNYALMALTSLGSSFGSDSKVKTGLGYKAASPVVESFVNSSEMLENLENVKSRSDKGYHVVPLPYRGNYIPPKPDLMFIDEQVESDFMDVVSNVASSDVKIVESKHESVKVKNKGVYSTIEAKPVRKNCFSPPIIKDWNFDD
nr:ribonuclease H-like domain-containing protein [Tanacetum cinerariifolium]